MFSDTSTLGELPNVVELWLGTRRARLIQMLKDRAYHYLPFHVAKALCPPEMIENAIQSEMNKRGISRKGVLNSTLVVRVGSPCAEYATDRILSEGGAQYVPKWGLPAVVEIWIRRKGKENVINMLKQRRYHYLPLHIAKAFCTSKMIEDAIQSEMSKRGITRESVVNSTLVARAGSTCAEYATQKILEALGETYVPVTPKIIVPPPPEPLPTPKPTTPPPAPSVPSVEVPVPPVEAPVPPVEAYIPEPKEPLPPVPGIPPAVPPVDAKEAGVVEEVPWKWVAIGAVLFVLLRRKT